MVKKVVVTALLVSKSFKTMQAFYNQAELSYIFISQQFPHPWYAGHLGLKNDEQEETCWKYILEFEIFHSLQSLLFSDKRPGLLIET